MTRDAAHATAGVLGPTSSDPIRVAVLHDSEIVVAGLTRMLESYADRVTVLSPQDETRAGDRSRVDVALRDPHLGPRDSSADLVRLSREECADRVVVLSWEFTPSMIDRAHAEGACGFLSMTLRAEEIVKALEDVVAGGGFVIRNQVAAPARQRATGDTWPGKPEGLTERESEIIGYIAQGFSNQALAGMAYLSINTVKSYIRGAYRKMGVTGRSTAVLWAIDHGFRATGPRRPDTFVLVDDGYQQA